MQIMYYSALLWLCLLCSCCANSVEESCYEEVGCFRTYRPYMPPPLSPAQIGLRFFLVGRNNTEVELKIDTASQYDELDLSKQTFFVIHGFNSSRHLFDDLKDAIALKRDANIVLVDWGPGSKVGDILQGTATTRVVGALVGRAIIQIVDNKGNEALSDKDTSGWTPADYASNYISFGLKDLKETFERKERNKKRLRNIIVIGQSLGAHIAGYAGRRVYQELGVKVRAIYGLDPSQRLYEFYDPDLALKKSDAEILVVAHTSGRLFVPTWGLGWIKPLGHIDFFFAGGGNQPGCPYPQPNEYLKISTPKELGSVNKDLKKKFALCSHDKIIDYTTESVLQTNCSFWGRRISDDVMNAAVSELFVPGVAKRGEVYPDYTGICDNKKCPKFDLDTYLTTFRGNFYVDVNGDPPYCLKESEKVNSSMPFKPKSKTRIEFFF